MKILIAIPAYNEQATLPGVLGVLPDEIEGASSIAKLVVDDGSTDGTADAARAGGAAVIRHEKNEGVGRAFQAAVEEALRRGVDAMVTIDADGQFDASQIADLVAPAIAGEADLVTGSRFQESTRPEGMPLAKYLGNRIVAGLLRFLTGTGLSDVSCGFRAYSREALLHLNLFGRFTYTQETILDLSFKGLRIREIPVRVEYFSDRRSRVAGSLSRYAINASKIIMRSVRDFRPLRFFGTLGLVVFSLGLALDGWVLHHYLNTGSFSPYKVVGFSGGALNIIGILLAGLGLLADMLGRIRLNQERILYHHKRHDLEERQRAAPD
jgi:glycosyltransferase involved in cell wall biosynthesis